MFLWTMSDRGIPRSYRMMQGFGVNTYTLVNAQGKRHFVKFHWIPKLGVHSLVWDEAQKLAGQDPDFHRKDLMEAIDNKVYPKWDFAIQVIPEEKEHCFDFDILDSTKIWPEDLIPLRVVGQMELNRNVQEFFAETEQAAFCTSHIVPGIDFSDDPLLVGRNFSYFDTQISRLGVNWEELPVNRPVCPVLNHNRDGKMRHRITKGTVNYWPNRFDAAPPATANQGAFTTVHARIEGIKKRAVGEKFREYISQAQLFWNSMSDHEKLHITKALGFELDHCDDPTVYNRLAGTRLAEIDLSLARKVADLVGAPVPQTAPRQNHGKRAPRLSQTEYIPAKPTIESRKIAIIIGDGYDASSVCGVKAAIKAAQATPVIIGLKRSPIYADGESSITSPGIIADHHYDGQRSTMFDATFIPDGSHINTLINNGQIRHWIQESFGHLKTIGGTGHGIDLIAASLRDVGGHLRVASIDDTKPVEWFGVVTIGKQTKEDSFGQTFEISKGATSFLGQFFYQISRHRNFERELNGLTLNVPF